MANLEVNPAVPRESAQASLQYIRRTLEAAGRLSSVSGGGMVTVGCLALIAVELNLRFTAAPWDSAVPAVALSVWAGLLILSAAIMAFAMARKARRAGQIFWSPVLRKAVAIATAPMLLGARLGVALLRDGAPARLPMIWLGCYGAALASAGVISVSPVRWMGTCFMLMATAALFVPPSAG